MSGVKLAAQAHFTMLKKEALATCGGSGEAKTEVLGDR